MGNVSNVITNIFHNIQSARGNQSVDIIGKLFLCILKNINYFFANFTQGYLIYLKIILKNFRDCSFSELGLVTSRNFFHKKLQAEPNSLIPPSSSAAIDRCLKVINRVLIEFRKFHYNAGHSKNNTAFKYSLY